MDHVANSLAAILGLLVDRAKGGLEEEISIQGSRGKPWLRRSKGLFLLRKVRDCCASGTYVGR